MSRGNSMVVCLVTGLAMALSLWAAPTDKAAAEAVAKGWLADNPLHLSAKFHSQLRSVESFNGFHVVHLQPEGFIITAADDELEPVLAFSDQGDFKYDPENPLWIMLNRDLPARAEHLRGVKTKLANLLVAKTGRLSSASKEDDAVMLASRQARDKWAKYRNYPPRPAAKTVMPVAQLNSGPTTGVMTNNTAAAPVHIEGIKIVDGHVQLTHDASGSVSIYASYDSGHTWQVVDAGIVWPTWTSKQSIQESSCWYRLALDQVYDDLKVSLMRHPSPLTGLPAMTNADVSAPGLDPILAGSVGAVSDVRVAPLLQSSWDQYTAQGVNCFNYYTPNNYVDGCVATALAQLMRYWQYPAAGIGQVTRTVYVNGSAQSATTRGGNGAGGAYNWNAMPLNPSSAAYNLAQWQMIGSLCYDAGVSVNMQYSASGSGAFMYLCAGALSTVFQYPNAQYVNYPANVLLPTDSNLAEGCPVLFGIDSSGRNGHAVVCDGFGYDSGTLYHHINMGWSGAYNAWYALPYLETPYGFNTIDTIIYNVFPSGTGELLTGRVLTSQGAPVPGALVMASASGQNYSGTTDSKGYYGIKVPSAQTYTVTASLSGMGNATRTGVVIGTSSTAASGNATGIDFTLNSNFSFSSVGLTNNVWLRWSAPTNSGLANNTVYIRYRTDHCPTSSSDGTLVYAGTAQSFNHTGVDSSGGVTNYYTIWGDNGGSYAGLGINVNTASVADSGTVRLLWTGISGEVYTWNLKASGVQKSGAYVCSGLLPMSYWKPSGFNDIDRDGVSDIIWTGAGGEVAYWLLNADGTMKTSGYVAVGNATGNNYWTVAGFNDIDRDGTADLIWTGAGGETAYWLLNADGTRKSAGLVTAIKLNPPTYWKVAGFNDIDHDGTADILWTGAGGEVAYWLLNAAGTMKSSGLVVSGNATGSGYWSVAGFADIDGDGTADILWSGAGGETAFWLLNANGSRKSYGTVYSTALTPGGYWNIRGFKDINLDGIPDVLWHGRGGETCYWLLNSNGTFRSGGYIQSLSVPPSYWTMRAVGSTGR